MVDVLGPSYYPINNKNISIIKYDSIFEYYKNDNSLYNKKLFLESLIKNKKKNYSYIELRNITLFLENITNNYICDTNKSQIFKNRDINSIIYSYIEYINILMFNIILNKAKIKDKNKILLYRSLYPLYNSVNGTLNLELLQTTDSGENYIKIDDINRKTNIYDLVNTGIIEKLKEKGKYLFIEFDETDDTSHNIEPNIIIGNMILKSIISDDKIYYIVIFTNKISIVYYLDKVLYYYNNKDSIYYIDGVLYGIL